MKYELSDRVQREFYSCPTPFLIDVIDTLFDEALDTDQVSIVADTYTTEVILKTICKEKFEDFEFLLQIIDFDKFDDEVDEYTITILTNGEVYVEPAIDKNAKYYDYDGFLFVEKEVSSDAYNGNNRHCNVMVFEIGEC